MAFYCQEDGCSEKWGSKAFKVGVLHSLTGSKAGNEKPIAEATSLVIEEINSMGGILGRAIEAVATDGRSDSKTFQAEAERLITEEKVAAVFGCWTSASRKTVKPIFEQHNHILFYPAQYEGLEVSDNIVYTGAAPNQCIIPAVKWAYDNLGHRFFLVGSVQSIDSRENSKFVRSFKERYGFERVTDSPMQAAYFGVYLWANAVEEPGQRTLLRSSNPSKGKACKRLKEWYT